MKIITKFFLSFVFLLISFISAPTFAEDTPIADKSLTTGSKITNQAEQTFWNTLHKGNYNNLPVTIRLLTGAYLNDPNNPKLAAHLGFAHMWLFIERNRNKTFDPQLVNHIILAKKYLADAVKLAPKNPVYLGFYADALFLEGKIFNNQKQEQEGYKLMQDAIKAWPEFNNFTTGYPLTILPADSKLFNDALEAQWQTLDLWAHQKINRNNPDFSPYMKNQANQNSQHSSQNSWIAPFGFEGFFLNMGDMLVKKGDWQTAVIIYNNAKLANNYQQWPYRKMLEDRITHAKENVSKFNQVSSLTGPVKEPTIMFNSRYACMVCHQSEGREQKKAAQ